MKLWGKFFLAILTLSLLSYGISDAAFAAIEPLSVNTNKEFYTEGATITISKEELDEKLSFLIEKGFLNKNEKDNEIFYSLDVDRLSKVLENDDNFKNIDDGLAKLDSFLN